MIANNRAWRSADTVRREWLRAVLTRKIPPKRSAGFLAAALARDAETVTGFGDNHLAAELVLGCYVNGYGRSSDLAAYIDQASEPRAKVLMLALALAGYEGSTHVGSWRNLSSATGRYLSFLARCGYVLADAERRAAGTPASPTPSKARQPGSPLPRNLPRFAPLSLQPTNRRIYLRANAASIPNYGERYRAGEVISSFPRLVHHQPGRQQADGEEAKQQMRWTLRGAHLLLQVRTRAQRRPRRPVPPLALAPRPASPTPSKARQPGSPLPRNLPRCSGPPDGLQDGHALVVMEHFHEDVGVGGGQAVGEEVASLRRQPVVLDIEGGDDLGKIEQHGSGPSTAQNLWEDGVLHAQQVRHRPRRRPTSLKTSTHPRPTVRVRKPTSRIAMGDQKLRSP